MVTVHVDRPWSFWVNFLDEGSSNEPRCFLRDRKTKISMKTLFLAVLSLVLMQPVRAEPPVVAATEQKVAQGLEPGRYLISCMERLGSGTQVHHGYILTIVKDGKPTIQIPDARFYGGGEIRVQTVMITPGDAGHFILNAHFTASKEVVVIDGSPQSRVPKPEVDKPSKNEVITNSFVLALSFNGESGGGSELKASRFGDGQCYAHLSAHIARLPDPAK